MSDRIEPEMLARLADIEGEFRRLKDLDLEWLIGPIAIWKSSRLANRPRNVPTYRRGLTFDLREDTTFVTEPFRLKDGSPAIAILLRSEDEEFMGGWVPHERAHDAEEVVRFLNGELAAAWAYHSERDERAVDRERPPRSVSIVETIAFDEGDEFAPDAPWGAERLTLSGGGAFKYERRHRGSTEGCRGTVDLAVIRRIEGLIAAAGFPQIPDHRLPPGASAVTLTVVAPGMEPTSLTFHRYFAARVPGYRDLVDALAGLNAALRSKDPAQIRAAGLTLE